MAVATASPKEKISLQTNDRHRSELSRAWRRFSANRMAVVAAIFIFLLCIVAIFADSLAPYSPTESERGMRGVAPSLAHPLGYDHNSRDLLSRVIVATRVALQVGLIASAIAVVIGVIIGAAAGFFGGWIDTILSRITDTLMAFPIIALLVVLAAVLGPSLTTVIIVIGATSWARYARVIRADVLSIRERDFILAARALGVKDYRIIGRHILPNILGPVIVLASLGVGNIIILESALSFLGLGIQPPNPSWGNILADGRAFITRFPHISIAPGVMITLTVLAFNFFGDGLRDALDPHETD